MELLAPAGSYQALVAAVEAGADAVYTGGKQFSARRQATNLDDIEMAKAVAYCHLRDRKLYVTVNTLIADSELEAVIEYIFRLQDMGIDGLIIQDLGLIKVCRQLFPELKLHASTQMSIHNEAGVRWAAEEGLSRVVLARELSMEQVQIIKKACPQMELEVFGHGALCFSFSGQCLFSSLVGGRSGNRGNCAQPCRLPYRLQGEASGLHNMPGQHLLSPADLCLLPHLREMEIAGVSSLKIEGRMKRPEYVATVTKVYRQALDKGELSSAEMQRAKQELTAAFNRNFTNGFWQGERESNWLSPQRPNNRGLLIGRIVNVQESAATIALKEELRIGDGIEVWTSSGSNAVTVVRRIHVDGQEVVMAPAGSRAEAEISGIGIGDRVFKTSDAAMIEQAQELATENRSRGRRQVTISVRAYAGEPFSISIRDLISGRQIEGTSIDYLSVARGKATTEEQIIEKIGELGDTVFAIQEIKIELDGQCLVPFSWIKEVRRYVVEELRNNLLAERMPPRVSQQDFNRKLESVFKSIKPVDAQRRPTLLTVAVDHMEAVQAALAGGADRVYLNLAGIKGQRLRATALRELLAFRKSGQQVLAMLPRIMLPREELPTAEQLDGIVVSNPGWLDNEASLKVGDYSLNVFNAQTTAYWLEHGLDQVTLSVELNLQQIKLLAARYPRRLECIVHGNIPIMTSRFCLLGYTDDSVSCEHCSRPCVRDDYCLKDRKGYQFPLRTDNYGRFYLYNSRTLCAVEEINEMVKSGVGAVRLHLPLATPSDVQGITNIYRQVLDKMPDADQWPRIKSQLRQLSPSDFTKLHYYRGVI